DRPTGGELDGHFRRVDPVGAYDFGDVLFEYRDEFLHPRVVMQSISAVPSKPRRAPAHAPRIALPLLFDQLHELLVQPLIIGDVKAPNRGWEPINARAGGARRLKRRRAARLCCFARSFQCLLLCGRASTMSARYYQTATCNVTPSQPFKARFSGF